MCVVKIITMYKYLDVHGFVIDHEFGQVKTHQVESSGRLKVIQKSSVRFLKVIQ